MKHTSNDLHYLKGVAPEYLGENNYINSLAVTDKNLITANGIAPIEFAREIFTKLKLRSDNDIEKWFQLKKKWYLEPIEKQICNKQFIINLLEIWGKASSPV